MQLTNTDDFQTQIKEKIRLLKQELESLKLFNHSSSELERNFKEVALGNDKLF